MKNAIRMYHLFFSRKCMMWFVYILYPFLGFAVGKFMSPFPAGMDWVMGLMVTVPLIISVEYILDTFMLFGIAAKDNKSLEYIKTSAKGVRVLRQGLLADGVRRVLSVGLILLGLYLVVKKELVELAGEVAAEEVMMPEIRTYVQCGILAVFLVELGMCLTRRTKNILLNVLLIYLMSALSCPLVIISVDQTSVASVIVLGMVMVVLMGISRKVLIKKVRESYYDEGYKELL